MAGAFQSDFVQQDAFQVDAVYTTTDSVTTADSSIVALGLSVTTVDTLTTSDTTSRSAGRVRTATDAVTTSDTSARDLLHRRATFSGSRIRPGVWGGR